MSATKKFPRNIGYEIVAVARDQEVLYYRQFGSYQGEWILLAYDSKTKKYIIYKDGFGSCSGCDSYQAEFDYGEDEISEESALKFIEQYQPFVEVPRSAMRSFCKSNTVASIFPANIQDTYSDVNYEEAVQEISIYVKRKEKLPISLEEIRAVKNAELKQELVKGYGYENFVRDIGAQTIHREGDNELLKSDDIVFVSVKDSSTDRRYLLRVPPACTTVKEAIAWTFNMSADQYQPIIET